MTSHFREIIILLSDGFSTTAFSQIIDTIYHANLAQNTHRANWSVVIPGQASATSEGGLEVKATIDLYEACRRCFASPEASAVVVLGFCGAEHFRDRHVMQWLRHIVRRRVRVGAIGSGPWLLANAGCLEGRRCVVHWESFEGLQERHPNVIVSTKIVEVDANIVTSAGGNATFDFILEMLEESRLGAVGRFVAHRMIASEPREIDQRQSFSRHSIKNRFVRSAVALMEENVQAPITMRELADRLGKSRRQIERLFSMNIGVSPKRYYLQLRLEASSRLVKQTDLPILEVAMASGFQSSSHFSKAYSVVFGTTPSECRRHSLQSFEPLSARRSA